MININEELEKRLAEYQQSELLLLDIDALTFDYKAQGLSVPPKDQLREEVIATARKRLEDELTCEAEGHFWKEEGDPENGSSDLTCQLTLSILLQHVYLEAYGQDLLASENAVMTLYGLVARKDGSMLLTPADAPDQGEMRII